MTRSISAPMTFLRSLPLLAGVVLMNPGATAQSPKPGSGSGAGEAAATAERHAVPGAEDRGWPREFEADGQVVRIYQPQLEAWPKFGRITFRAALAVGAKDGTDRTYGIVRASADTEIAFDERLVVLTNRTIESVEFPDVDAAVAKRLGETVRAAMPAARPQTISLDRLIAEMAPLLGEVRTAEVSVAPPRIMASEKPAVLVLFMGTPRFKAVPDSDLLFAINTNWDLFLDPSTKRYYLLQERSWLVTEDIERGPWTAAVALPTSLSRLPADENWADVREAIPGDPPGTAPVVFVAHEPTELIVTRGAPEMTPIAGTGLLLVSNTDSDLLYHASERNYYFLAAGRWFRAPAMTGPWTAASQDLPADFRLIPESSEAGHLLASVPGTVQAQEASILASVPRKATIQRADVTMNVTYNGPPDFRPITATTVTYAHNSPYSVFGVDGKYYCCYDAVWFVSAAPSGPWAVCDAVPAAIYTIPASDPHHYVTYVTVYQSTPTTVVTGYTAGYSGETVAATGVVMFGLGVLVGLAIDDDDDCCWAYHYRSCYFSYGCGAIYVQGRGGYVCGVAHYGPYGGAGRWAMYNPATGTYSRGGYAYGPRGAAGYRAAYNPSTGVGGYRAGGSGVYGSWGRGAISNGDEWVRGGFRSGERGSIGGVQGSEGAGVVHVEGRFGNGVTVVRDRDGDVYAGKDGKVYRRTDDGWTGERAVPASTSEGSKRPAEQASRTTKPPAEAGDLERAAANRDRGDRNAARTKQAQRGERTSRPQGGRGRR
ncbi:MAG: hypothetical protein JNL80_03080 [Phycisphaerae bacterium]|nr:hypothetical protein [Phycisphaerae bacterium]